MNKKADGIPQPYGDRLARVRAEITKRKLDGYLIVNRMDQYWLTGFTGEDGQVLVTEKAVSLLTDGRFTQTTELEAPWARSIIRKKRTPKATAREISRTKVRRIGFDPTHMNVATYAALAKLIKPAQLKSASGVILEMRRSKDATEVAQIRAAIRIAEQAFEQLKGWIAPGMTEAYVAGRLGFEMQSLGAQSASFPTIVAAGANGSLPHYDPSERIIGDNEGVLIDWGARAGWYVSDLTRMVWLGNPAPELRTIHEVVSEAHDRAVEAVRPGIKAKAVDRVARDIITNAGYGDKYIHGTGHGIGLDIHEAPRLAKNSDDVLRPGMVVTIEPGIYLPGVGGVRLEDDVLVTDTGYEKLSSLPL